MQNFATSIFGVRSFVVCTTIMVVWLKHTTLTSGNYYCKAWVVVDSIASNLQKRQNQRLQIHRHYHEQKQVHLLWRPQNIQKKSYRDHSVTFNTIRRHTTTLPVSPITSTTSITSERNNDPMEQDKNEINQRIYNVARTMCNLSPNQIAITWKSKRIVVTVHTENAFLDTSVNDGEDNDEAEIEIDLVDEEDFLDSDDDDDDIEDDIGRENAVDSDIDYGDVATDTFASGNMNTLVISTTKNVTPDDDDATAASAENVDLTLLARSINVALDDGEDGIGTRITQQYEIEVSTPGIISDDITTPRMFAAYRGFDVIVHYLDPKKKVLKQHEGRLVEKNEEHVIINQKGRMKHFKNIHVQAVKLPKFKSEKGSR